MMRDASAFRPSVGPKLLLLLGGTLLAGCASELDDPTRTPGSGTAGQVSGAGASGAGSPAVGPGGTGTTASGGAGQLPSGGTGGPEGTGGSGSATASDCARVPVNAAPSVLRRLSQLEYRLTVQDLFQLASPPDAEGIPADTDKDGFKTFAEVQTVSAQHLRAYLEKASELADALLLDSARRSRVVGCELTATDCLRAFVTRFGALAFRRPLDGAEIESLTENAQANAIDQTDRFRFVIETVLTMPSFLYRVEVGDEAEGLSTLRGTELASRLSFALWGRGPSAELLEQAAQGELDSQAGLSRVAASMLADPKAQHFFAGFFRQWLGFDVLRAPVEAPAGWSNGLLGEMQNETDSVLREFAWGPENFLDVLNANRTRASSELATFFRLPTPSADGLVEFPQDHVRANTGLLTHPALLSAKSDGDKIAIRGNWLRETFLCSHMEIPASLQAEIGEVLVGLSPVEIVQKRNTETACRGCHAIIDPIGVGFAKFDSLGRYDATQDVARYGVAPGLPDAPEPSFDGIAELSAKLRALPQVSECLAKKLFIYVNGREAAADDACAVDAATRAFQSGGSKFSSLIQGLVEVPAFRVRRAPAATAP